MKGQTLRAFDLAKGSIGEAVRLLHKLWQPTREAITKIKKGRAKRPVQELRLLSGSSFDLRSQADRFLRTADPQVLISKKE